MKKNLIAAAWLILAASGLSLVAQTGKSGNWKGIVTDQMCANKGANLTDSDCAKRCVAAGSKYALYDTATKKVYVLNPQEEAAKHAGQAVSVKGTIEGDTITASTISMAKKS